MQPRRGQTILDEVLDFRPDYIEHQLAHAVCDPNERAYKHTAHLPERRKMMQQWADYLDKLKTGADIIPINQNAWACAASMPFKQIADVCTKVTN